MQRGWFSYSQAAEPGLAPGPLPASQPLRPELADVGRLGRRLLHGVVRTARAEQNDALGRRILDHLGGDGGGSPVVQESWPGYEQVNVQLGLDAWLASATEVELLGVIGFHHSVFGLADLIGGTQVPFGPRLGNVSRMAVASGPDGQTTECVACGVYLVDDGHAHSVVLLRGPDRHSGNNSVTVEIASTDAQRAAASGADIRRLAVEKNAFRGQVLSFGGEVFGPDESLLHFHHRPALARDAIVLPDGVLAAIERQVVDVTVQKQRLLASGQHLKRGVLLYGPPGVGKTHTIRYLLGRLGDTTVIQLSGNALHLVAQACSVARTLQPSLIVIEDVDLIAEERGAYPGEHPMLFQLLNEMDGLTEDADVAFLLTTNRADLLEPALAARPGRVDQAVELTLPDADGRRALVGLYRGRLRLPDDGIDEIVARTDGVTASFIKELLRRAALIAAASGPDGADGAGPLTVSSQALEYALGELLDMRNAMTRALLGGKRAGRHGEEQE